MSILLSDALPAPDSNLPFSGLWQAAIAVLLVAVLLIVLRWLSNRVSLPRHPGSPRMQVIASLAVGQNQRIVILDLPDCRLVVGVTTQHINHLYTLPAGEPADTSLSRPPVSQAFLSQWRSLLAGRGK
ncbi:flagellar biosynthetic protein FliO [Tatumella morbirosei]|uniref:flagellar biosynthetic protein FliO n=1 Tax=Tatumella morbirosei TaxID=642227 RepID=UPI000699FCE4|nr:flagellar biosynthetic protein FliO [Tatumella morbirosei]